MHRFRLTLRLAAAAAVLLPLSFATGAQAAQAPASGHATAPLATSFQAMTVAAALRNNPTGVQIAPNEVSWDNGKVIMVVPATPDGSVTPDGSASRCPSGLLTGDWTCVFDQGSWNGTMLQFQDAGYAQDLHYYGGSSWFTLSYANTRGQRSWIRKDQFDGDPPQYCMSGNSAASLLPSSDTRDRWIYLTTNYAHC
jgi:hypothetical protein